MKSAHFLIWVLFLMMSFGEAALSKERERLMDVLGIGIIDVETISFISDDQLKRDYIMPYNIQKGRVNVVDDRTMDTMVSKLKSTVLIPGGEVAGVLYNFANLGGKATLTARASNDEYGKLFLKNLDEFNIDFVSMDKGLGNNSTVHLVLITPDAEATKILKIGSSSRFSQRDFKYHLIKDYKFLLLDASLWDGKGKKSKAVFRAINTANRVGTKVAFLLGDEMYVRAYKKDMLWLIQYADFVFANELEVKTLFNVGDIEEVQDQLMNFKGIFVVTLGEKGALIFNNGERVKVDIFPLESPVIDTSGAGRAFAAGFLYGISKGESLEKSGNIAAKVASQMVQQIGSKPNKKLKE